MKTPIRWMPGLLGLAAGTALGAPLSEGEFTRVINDVKVLPVESKPLPAKPGDRISGRTAVATGAQSRAELRFSDNTLTRLGANSVFRMDHATRTVDVEKGVILLQVPKQLGGAKVRTAAVTAAVTGTTVLLEFTEDGFIKIIVIEGEVDVSLNERLSQFKTLVAGDMWISRTDDKRGLPMPVQVDLERLKKTSKLLSDKEFPPLGNQKQMQGALKDQGQKKQKGDLVGTSFVIEGRGRNVTTLLADRQHIPVGDEPPPVEPPPVDRPPVDPPPGPKGPINIVGTTVFDNRSTITTSGPSNAYNSVAGGFTYLPGAPYLPGQDGLIGGFLFNDPLAFKGLDALLSGNASWFVLKGDEIYISGSPAVNSTNGSPNLIMAAAGDINFTPYPPFETARAVPNDLWTLDDGISDLVFASLTGWVHFEGFNLVGTDQNVTFHADGPASDVHLGGNLPSSIFLPGGSFEAFAGQDVEVHGATVEAKTIKMTAGREVRVGGGNAGATRLAASDAITLKAKQGVKISNSSELRRLSQLDNPQILIEAANGHAEIIENSTVDADVVNVISQRGDVRIMNSSIAAREIKGRVFNSGGTLLLSNAILGRGTNPSDLIRLYGEGSNGVRFVGDTTLRGNLVQIAGSTVTIDPGSRVRLSNRAGTTVFADSHLYNNGINGNFTNLGSANCAPKPVHVNQQPFANRPGF